MSPTGFVHGEVEGYVYALLLAFVRRTGSGRVATGEVGCKLPNGRVRAPDVLFVRAERVAAEGPPAGFLPGAPDLAVEVLSPEDGPGEVKDKANEWIAAGTDRVWAVDPSARTVTVYRHAVAPEVLGESDTLEGGAVLPGFVCRVAEIFG